MSISSSWYASYANSIKKEWEDKLQQAINKKDWSTVQKLLTTMKSFYFSE